MNDLYAEGFDDNLITEMIICFVKSYDQCHLFLHIFFLC